MIGHLSNWQLKMYFLKKTLTTLLNASGCAQGYLDPKEDLQQSHEASWECFTFLY